MRDDELRIVPGTAPTTTLALYYVYQGLESERTYGGRFSDWASLLAMLPLSLTDRRWEISRITSKGWHEHIVLVDVFV